MLENKKDPTFYDQQKIVGEEITPPEKLSAGSWYAIILAATVTVAGYGCFVYQVKYGQPAETNLQNTTSAFAKAFNDKSGNAPTPADRSKPTSVRVSAPGSSGAQGEPLLSQILTATALPDLSASESVVEMLTGAMTSHGQSPEENTVAVGCDVSPNAALVVDRAGRNGEFVHALHCLWEPGKIGPQVDPAYTGWYQNGQHAVTTIANLGKVVVGVESAKDQPKKANVLISPGEGNPNIFLTCDKPVTPRDTAINFDDLKQCSRQAAFTDAANVVWKNAENRASCGRFIPMLARNGDIANEWGSPKGREENYASLQRFLERQKVYVPGGPR